VLPHYSQGTRWTYPPLENDLTAFCTEEIVKHPTF